MASEDVEITHDEARDESRCGLFCDEEPDVSFEAFGYTFHRCRSCYEEPCSRCGEEIEDDSNKPKGWCQSCREEIRLICGGDEERGIEKDEDSEQATLMTDGGRAEYDRTTYRPPCHDEVNTHPRAHLGDLERRVCPTCRLFYDAGEDSERVFCSLACERRYDQGEVR